MGFSIAFIFSIQLSSVHVSRFLFLVRFGVWLIWFAGMTDSIFFFFLLFFSRIFFFLPDGNRRSCHENQRKNNGVTLEKYSRLAGFLSFITNLLVIFYIWSAFWITTKGITGFNWNSFFLDCILCIFSGFFGGFFYWRLKGFLRFFFFDWVALVLI